MTAIYKHPFIFNLFKSNLFKHFPQPQCSVEDLWSYCLFSLNSTEHYTSQCTIEVQDSSCWLPNWIKERRELFFVVELLILRRCIKTHVNNKSIIVWLYSTKTEQVREIWISFETFLKNLYVLNVQRTFKVAISGYHFLQCRILISIGVLLSVFRVASTLDIFSWFVFVIKQDVTLIFACECILSVSIILHYSYLSYHLWSAGLKTAYSMSTHHPGICNRLRVVCLSQNRPRQIPTAAVKRAVFSRVVVQNSANS